MSSRKTPGPELGDSLVYLLKHAYLDAERRVDAALVAFGLNARELGVLVAVAGPEPLSQQQLAQRLGVDRTTMVALLDALERKGVVGRRPHTADRRRNVVELTDTGRVTFDQALIARDAAEANFLGPLNSGADAQRLRETLKILNTHGHA